MKKFTKIAALLSGLAVMIFAGCSNISDSTVSGNGIGGNRQIALNCEVGADCDLVDFSTLPAGDGRTITPDALDSSKVVFYLGGTNISTNSPVYASKIAFTGVAPAGGGAASKTKGTVTVDLEAANYSFILAAFLTADDPTVTPTTTIESLLNKAVLVGYANADLRYSDEAAGVNFYLTADGLSGTGEVEIGFYLDKWDPSSAAALIGGAGGNASDKVTDHAKFGLYDFNDGSVVDEDTASVTACVAVASKHTYSKTGVAAGTYTYAVSFERYDSQNKLHVYTYSTDIKVLPGQKTSATIGIPDILTNAPAAPSDFKQAYGAPESAASNNYYTYFTWTDNSSTEQYFEIELCDVTGIAAVTVASANDEDLWTANSAAANTTSYGTGFYGYKAESVPSWYAGSLQKNNKFAAFYMPLGSRYIARIRAVNDAGFSAWVYAASDDITYSIPLGSSTADSASLAAAKGVTGTKFSTDIINLFRVSYNPYGGTYTGTAKTAYYFDQTATGADIMAPDGKAKIAGYNSGNEITLKKGTKIWANWKIGSTDGKVYPNSYTAASAGANPNDGTLYYVEDTTKDINDNYEFILANPQPDPVTASHYTNNNIPAKYMGYKNLTLYANYTKNTFGVEIFNDADYKIEENMDVSVTGTGSGTTPALTITSNSDDTGNLMVKRSGSSGASSYVTSKLTWALTYKTSPKVKYSKVEAEWFSQGGSVGTGDDSVGAFVSTSLDTPSIDMGISTLPAGKYKIVFKGYVGSKPTPYTYSVYLDIQD